MNRGFKALLAGTTSTLLIGALAIGCGDDDTTLGGPTMTPDGATPDANAAEAARTDSSSGNVDGSSGGTDTGVDAPTDATTDAPDEDAGLDASSDADADGGPTDAGSDAADSSDAADAGDGAVACVVGTACNSPAGGVCKGTGCATCIAKTDDALCASAYGAGQICVNSACIVGNCHADSDCKGTPATPACMANTCSACPAQSGNVFGVDPVNGSDTTGTGAATSGACAFRTVQKAIAAINALAGGAPVGTQIQFNGPNSVAASETFPWVIPANTTVNGTGGNSFISIQSAIDAVQLTKSGSGIKNFALSGNNKGSHGVVVNGTATVSTVKISNLAITGFTQGGILVNGTNPNVGVTLGDNVQVFQNGTLGVPSSGLTISDTAAVVIDVQAGSAIGTAFHTNTASGIDVGGQAKLDIIGLPYVALCGSTVSANYNTGGGITFHTAPGAGGGATPTSTLTGIVACNNSTGLWVEGTARLKVRNSRFANNATGIHVQASSAGGLANADDLSGIDFGTDAATDPGKNLIQAAAGAGQNTNVGLCFQIHPSKSETLRAFGNTWMTTAQTDCSLAANAGKQLTSSPSITCTGTAGVSYAGQGVTGNTLAVGVCVP